MGKELIKQLLRENLSKQETLEEGKLKNFVAGAAMGLGALAGGKAQAQQAPTKDAIRQHHAEMKHKNDSIRAARAEKRASNVKSLHDTFAWEAVVRGYGKQIGQDEYNAGVANTQADDFSEQKLYYLERNGEFYVVNLKNYRKMRNKESNQADVDRYQGQLYKTNANGERMDAGEDSPETNRKHCTAGKCAVEKRAASGEFKNK